MTVTVAESTTVAKKHRLPAQKTPGTVAKNTPEPTQKAPNLVTVAKNTDKARRPF